MSRIPPVVRPQIDPSLAKLMAEADQRLPQFMNQILTLSHHPPIAHDLVTMYLGFQDHSRVDRRLIELAVLTVSYLNQCNYCVSHHVPLGADSGLSADALADLAAGQVAESEHFSSTEKLVVAYAKQMTTDARRVPSDLFNALSAEFDQAQLVELTVRIGLANFFNRLNDALQIEIEDGVAPLF